MKRKGLLIGIGVLFFLVAFFVFLNLPKRKGGFPSPNVPARPNIPNYTKGSFQITTTLAKESFSFPEALPLVTLSLPVPLSETAVLGLAAGLAFGDNYLPAEDFVGGKTYIFNDGERSLTIYEKTNNVVYVSGKAIPSSDKNLSDEELISRAEDFLVGSSLAKKETLFFSSINYLAVKEEDLTVVPRGEANAFKINFAPVQSDIKFVELNPLSSGVSVWLSAGGEVVKSETNGVSKASFSSEMVPVKNYEEFIDGLSAAIIVSLADGNLFPGDLAEGSIRRITVDKAEIAYFKESSTTNFYQPVFLLTGLADVKNFGSLPVALYLPAVKGL